MKAFILVATATLVIAACASESRVAAPVAAGPELAALAFDKDGKIVIPARMDSWPTVGTTYALSYEGDGGTTLNSVRLDPVSYEAYVKTGKYPVGAIMQLEVRKPMTEVSPAKGGKTQGEAVAHSLHVKDEKGGPGTWTFYSYGPGSKTGNAVPRSQACYSCHQDNAKDDTTFTQFYPTLTEARAAAQ